jgi:starvation-inducible DNA-binding protein
MQVERALGCKDWHARGAAQGNRRRVCKLLADTYTLLGKTHGFYWNVEGPAFHSLHEMFQK